jgi:hypothetical protein
MSFIKREYSRPASSYPPSRRHVGGLVLGLVVWLESFQDYVPHPDQGKSERRVRRLCRSARFLVLPVLACGDMIPFATSFRSFPWVLSPDCRPFACLPRDSWFLPPSSENPVNHIFHELRSRKRPCPSVPCRYLREYCLLGPPPPTCSLQTCATLASVWGSLFRRRPWPGRVAAARRAVLRAVRHLRPSSNRWGLQPRAVRSQERAQSGKEMVKKSRLPCGFGRRFLCPRLPPEHQLLTRRHALSLSPGQNDLSDRHQASTIKHLPLAPPTPPNITPAPVQRSALWAALPLRSHPGRFAGCQPGPLRNSVFGFRACFGRGFSAIGFPSPSTFGARHWSLIYFP